MNPPTTELDARFSDPASVPTSWEETRAVRVTADDVLERLPAAWAEKWDGRWRYEAREGALHHHRGEALVFSVTPGKVLAFGKGRFSHTRHRF